MLHGRVVHLEAEQNCFVPYGHIENSIAHCICTQMCSAPDSFKKDEYADNTAFMCEMAYERTVRDVVGKRLLLHHHRHLACRVLVICIW